MVAVGRGSAAWLVMVGHHGLAPRPKPMTQQQSCSLLPSGERGLAPPSKPMIQQQVMQLASVG